MTDQSDNGKVRVKEEVMWLNRDHEVENFLNVLVAKAN